jgi:hypothetical protein
MAPDRSRAPFDRLARIVYRHTLATYAASILIPVVLAVAAVRPARAVHHPRHLREETTPALNVRAASDPRAPEALSSVAPPA